MTTQWWEKITRAAIVKLQSVLYEVDRSNYDQCLKKQPKQDAYGGLIEILRHWIVNGGVRSWDISKVESIKLIQQLGACLKQADFDSQTTTALSSFYQFMDAELRASALFEKTTFDFRRFVERFLETNDEDLESVHANIDDRSDPHDVRAKDLSNVKAPTSLHQVSGAVIIDPAISKHPEGPVGWLVDQAAREMIPPPTQVAQRSVSRESKESRATQSSHSSWPSILRSDDTFSEFSARVSPRSNEDGMVSRDTLLSGISDPCDAEQQMKEISDLASDASTKSKQIRKYTVRRIVDNIAKRVGRVMRRNTRYGDVDMTMYKEKLRADGNLCDGELAAVYKCPLLDAGLATTCYRTCQQSGVWPGTQETHVPTALKGITKCFPCEGCWQQHRIDLEHVTKGLTHDDWADKGVYGGLYRKPAANQQLQELQDLPNPQDAQFYRQQGYDMTMREKKCWDELSLVATTAATPDISSPRQWSIGDDSSDSPLEPYSSPVLSNPRLAVPTPSRHGFINSIRRSHSRGRTHNS